MLSESRDSSAPSTTAQTLSWARGARPVLPEGTVPDIFARWAQSQPDAVAVREGTLIWTYAQLAAQAARVAEAIRAAGIAPANFIGLPAARSTGFVAGALGILQASCAYLPVDEQEPTERQQLRLSDCAGLLRWKEGKLQCEPLPGRAAGEPGAAYLLYTSGSSGTPKGVMVPHAAIVRLVCATDYLTIQPDDVFAFHSSTSFDASTLELWGPLLNGASLVVTATETVLSSEALAAHLREFGVTILWLTTSLFAQLAEEAPAMFAGLRTLIFGGEAADVTAVRRVCEHGRPQSLINGYGPTECTTFAVCHRIEEPAEHIPIGHPIAHTDAFVLDEEIQPAVEGELFLGGLGLALGYRNAPELTAERFLETPFGRLYRTGDLARWRADGTLDYLGRRDRQVKVRGFRIEPGEVEAAVRQVPGITRAVVLPRRAPSGDPCLVCYYLGGPDGETLRESLKAHLPAQMVPAVCLRVESLPITANGKLDEQALPPAFPARITTPIAIEGITPLQTQIQAAWAEVLGFAGVGLDDNFFDLGGTSLSLLRAYRLLHASFADLRVVALFQNPTVRALATFLEAGRGTWHPGAAALRAQKGRQVLARRRLPSK